MAAEPSIRIPWSVEVVCIVAGALLAVIGAAVSRLLRHRVEGFVVSPVDDGSYAEAVQIGGALLVADSTQSSATADPVGGGGSFGGGGASGDTNGPL